MSMSTTSTSSAAVETARFERACEWFIELREKPQSPEVVAQWLEWCRADPLNREAFERARSVWQVTGEVRPEDLALPALSSSATHIAETSRHRKRRWPPFVAGGALAASLAAAVLYLWPLTHLTFTAEKSVRSEFTTQQRENRTVELSDGSTLALGADSRVRTEFHEDARQLTLEHGEAFFRVKHDRSRPFVVTAGDFRVTAVGTAFNVRTASERVVVGVAEGVVDIDPPAITSPPEDGAGQEQNKGHVRPSVLRQTLRVASGQEVVLDVAEEQLQVVHVEPKSVASWQTGRLQFVREPLHAVLTSVNRYSPRQVTLTDPTLGDLRFTGTVFSDRVEDWIRGLPEIFPVKLRDDGVTVVIEVRTQSERGASAIR